MSPWLLLIACIGGSAESPTTPPTEAPVEAAAVVPPLQVRPSAPALVRTEQYKTRPDDTTGFLQNATDHDNGLKVKQITYSFYGTGEVDSTTTWTYDDAGHMISSFDGNTTSTWTYDAEGRPLTEGWSRPGQGATTQHTYDEHGNIAVFTYLKLDGTVDYTREVERTYSDAGKALSEKKWEKYTDGTDPLLQYHYANTNDADGRVTSVKRLNDDGSTLDEKRHRYDSNGSELEESEHDSTGALTGRTVMTYNAFGEVTKSVSESCGESGCDPWSTTTWTYSEYGHVLTTMLTQDSGDDWGERTVYTYAAASVEPATP